ncbi:hypothetical protein HOH45_09230 [bacterium]|nr:hypothetical protein [bacterium]
MVCWSLFTTLLLWLFFGMHHVLYGNETDYFLQARGFFDTQFLGSDWYFQSTKAGLVMYSLCTGLFLKIFSPILIFCIGRLICMGAFVISFFGLCKKLGIRLQYAFMSLLLFIGLGQSVGAGEHIFGTFEPKNISYFLIMASLSYLFSKKQGVFFLFLGLSFSFHPVLGGWGGVIILSSAALFGMVNFSGKCMCALFISGSWGFYFWVHTVYSFMVSKINGIEPEVLNSGLSVFDSYVFFRNPHHLDIRTILSGMGLGSVTVFIGVIAFLILMIISRDGYVFEFLKNKGKIGIGRQRGADSMGDDRQRRFKAFLISIVMMSLIPVCIGAVLGFFRVGSQFLMTYPFRFFDSFAFLISILLLIHYVTDSWLERKTVKYSKFINLCGQNKNIIKNFGVAGLLLIVCCFGSLGLKKTNRAISALSHYPKGFGSSVSYSKTSFYDACDWASKNTPSSAIFLVSPRLFSFVYLAERSSFLVFKFSPTSPSLIQEWMGRVLALNDGVIPKGRGFDSLNELSHKFYSMGPKKIDSLSEKYGIDYLFTAQQVKLPYKVAYETGDWVIYNVSKSSVFK